MVSYAQAGNRLARRVRSLAVGAEFGRDGRQGDPRARVHPQSVFALAFQNVGSLCQLSCAGIRPCYFLRMNSCRQICPVLFATVSLKASYPAPEVQQTVDIPMQVMTSLLILANFITNIWDAETRSERGQEAFHVAIEGGAAVLFRQSRCEMHGLVNTHLFVTRTQGFLIKRRKSMITAFLISSKSPSQ